MGTESPQAFVRVAGQTERRDVKDVKSLAHALRHDSEDEAQLEVRISTCRDGEHHHPLIPALAQIEVHWPRNKCRLLKDDVIILDSPGLDYNERFDEWIDTTARDADVFILVVNAVGTLSGTEARFFENVRQVYQLRRNRACTVVEPNTPLFLQQKGGHA